jgi:hypothetical protein
MPQPHRSLTALPAVAATAVALVSGCSGSGPTPHGQPSITFGSQASTTPGMAGQGPPAVTTVPMTPPWTMATPPG